MKGFQVKPKLVKFLVKNTIGLAIAALIGVIIKQEYVIDEIIDDYFKNR